MPNQPVPAEVKSKYPGFTTKEYQAYQIRTTKYFKGTIAVCVIYGTFIAILLLLSLFGPGNVIIQSFFPFLVTFIAGVLIIIAALVYALYNLIKPIKFVGTRYDKYICPDYWKLVEAEAPKGTDNKDLVDDVRKPLYNYMCVPDKNVYRGYDLKVGSGGGYEYATHDSVNLHGHKVYNRDDKRVVYRQISQPSEESDNDGKDISSALAKASAEPLFNFEKISTTDIDPTKNFRCDQVFPAVMAAAEELTFPNDLDRNKLRCKYASVCGIPWTGVCPSGNTTSQ